MPDHMKLMLVFALGCLSLPAGFEYGAAQRKAQDRLEPIRWIVDAPQHLAIGQRFITSEPVLKKFDTRSACRNWVIAENKKFPEWRFPDRCIREDGVRSIWKANPWKTSRYERQER